MVNYIDRLMNSRVIFWLFGGGILLIIGISFWSWEWQMEDRSTPICYKIFATPENAAPHCGGSTGSGRFYGDLCIGEERLDWDFQFSGGVGLHKFPTKLYIAGPTTEKLANSGMYDVSIFVLLNTDSLVGPEFGEMEGSKSLTPIEGNYLVSKPNQFILVALDDTTGGESCDWVSWIVTSTLSH